MRLHKHQSDIVKAGTDRKIFLHGPAGTGKTTTAVHRLSQLVKDGVPGEEILILVPQKALAFPYYDEIRNPRRKAGGDVTVATLGSLALQMVDLFWPLVSDVAGFADPYSRPHFLSLELVQYYMGKVLGPEIDSNDYFNTVRISRNRLYSQLVDTLNKSAVVRFPAESIGEKLIDAVAQGDISQQYVYQNAQTVANSFREFCRQHNILDFSLQVRLLVEYLWKEEAPRHYLVNKYRHLIVDNIEEDTPATHDLLRSWLQVCDSALILYDDDAGYRRFLGADPISASELQTACDETVQFERNYVMSDDLSALAYEMGKTLGFNAGDAPEGNARDAIIYNDNRYHTGMLDWCAENIAGLIHDQGVSPKEIVVLAPLLSDALRFSLTSRFEARDVPVYSHRPSRALREEPAVRALVTLAKIAHPTWDIRAQSYDVTFALMSAIRDFDLTRARLLTEVVYREGSLHPFEGLHSGIQQRITYDLGGRYETLYQWLEKYRRTEDPTELDVFFSEIFGEVLSQPGFGFHDDFDAARAAANLIDSARNFRQTVQEIEPALTEVGKEYIEMVDDGVIADQYIRDWELHSTDAVLIAPAYTFLMSNQPVEYQFWITVGSTSWGQRLYQPLTHPHVLSRQWQEGRLWTDADEQERNREFLYTLATGLIRRCKQKIYLGYSQYGEQGYEQRGPLLEAIQRMLRRMNQEAGT